MEEIQNWVDPFEGFEYTTDTVFVETAEQAERLNACGLDPEIFGRFVDPSFYIGLAIQAGVESGISAEGNVNMLQALTQHRKALLDEPLQVKGRIVAVTDVPRGCTIDTDVWFEDARGDRVITARRLSLKPDRGKKAERGAGDRPPAVIENSDLLERVGAHRLTPRQVQDYSSEGNSIHYDMEAANRAGFRAPLIGGGMGVHYLMAWLFEARGQPEKLDLDIYFRRPIFWDASFEVAISEPLTAICLLTEEAGQTKILTEARINQIM